MIIPNAKFHQNLKSYIVDIKDALEFFKRTDLNITIIDSTFRFKTVVHNSVQSESIKNINLYLADGLSVNDFELNLTGILSVDFLTELKLMFGEDLYNMLVVAVQNDATVVFDNCDLSKVITCADILYYASVYLSEMQFFATEHHNSDVSANDSIEMFAAIDYLKSDIETPISDIEQSFRDHCE